MKIKCKSQTRSKSKAKSTVQRKTSPKNTDIPKRVYFFQWEKVLDRVIEIKKLRENSEYRKDSLIEQLGSIKLYESLYSKMIKPQMKNQGFALENERKLFNFCFQPNTWQVIQDKEQLKNQLQNFSLEKINEQKQFLNFNGHILTYWDVSRIQKPNWFNDIVINFYISLLKLEECKQAFQEFYQIKLEKIYIFSTFFCMQYSQSNALRNSKETTTSDRKKQFNKTKQSLRYIWEKIGPDFLKNKTILIPHHEVDHWILICLNNFDNFCEELTNYYSQNKRDQLAQIYFKQKLKIRFFDSLLWDNSDFYNKISKQLLVVIENIISLCLNKKEEKRTKIFYRSMNYETLVENAIQQNNMYDCGVALLENIEYCIANSTCKQIYQLDYKSQIFQQKRDFMIDLFKKIKNNAKDIKSHFIRYFIDKSSHLNDC